MRRAGIRFGRQFDCRYDVDRYGYECFGDLLRRGRVSGGLYAFVQGTGQDLGVMYVAANGGSH